MEDGDQVYESGIQSLYLAKVRVRSIYVCFINFKLYLWNYAAYVGDGVIGEVYDTKYLRY